MGDPITTRGWCEQCKSTQQLQLTMRIWKAQGQAHSWSCTHCGTTGWHDGEPAYDGGKQQMETESTPGTAVDESPLRGQDHEFGPVMVSIPLDQLRQMEALLHRVRHPQVEYQPSLERMTLEALVYSRTHAATAAELLARWLGND